LIKIGTGIWSLTGTSSISGALLGRMGTLDVSGNFTDTLYITIGEASGNTGSAVVRGSGLLKSAGDFNIGELAGSTGQLTVSNNGAAAANVMYVGKTSATGTLNVQGSASVTSTFLNVGCFGTATGVVNQSGGIVAISSSDIRIGGSGSSADSAAV